jgi:hypothetical protein
MSDAAIEREKRPWRLADLADEAEFDRHVEAAASAIADRCSLQTHINLAARQRAYGDWLERVRSVAASPLDYRAFVSICAALVEALAQHRSVTFSATTLVSDRLRDTMLRYGNEVIALAVGGALYSTAVEGMTGTQPGEALSAFLWENAATNLRHHRAEAAPRFRELLKLSTPWM